ncbi:hypothetical protein H4R20_004006, partial [Coemansia guatemalensis]
EVLKPEEEDEEKSFAIKRFFMDDDGTVDKSKIAAVSALLAGSGFAIKKTYDHFNEEEEQAQQQLQEEQGGSTNHFKEFFTDEDGVDKSHVAMAAALFGGIAYAGKKIYDRRNQE